MASNGKGFIFVANQSCIDFVNTEIVEQGRRVDLLSSFGDLLSWMMLAKMITLAKASAAMGDWSGANGLAILNEAKRFRGVMRELADQISRGTPVRQTTLTDINQRLRAGSLFPQIFKKGRSFERRPECDFTKPADFLATLAHSAADLLCNYDLSTLKKCKNPACILYFCDTTKNHSRNWCSMEICGNRTKVAAFYLRSKLRRSGPEKRRQTHH